MNEGRDNAGTLSRNADKARDGANPKWPDYKGKATVEGRAFWLAGWIKEGPHGKFLSLAFTARDDRDTRTDDNVPF